MGCSNPHPHGQVWSMSELPDLPAKELENMRKYSIEVQNNQSDAPCGPNDRPCLLCDYIHHELSLPQDEGRVVVSNHHWAAVVPYWAVWPFEVLCTYNWSSAQFLWAHLHLVLPHSRHIPSLQHLTEDEIDSFASILKALIVKYDNLFSTSFAYSMGIHQRPIPGEADDNDDIAHLHLHFNPPLLRSATVRKFLVGYVILQKINLF